MKSTAFIPLVDHAAVWNAVLLLTGCFCPYLSASGLFVVNYVVTVLRLNIVYPLIVSMPEIYCIQGRAALYEAYTVVALHVTAVGPVRQDDIAVAATDL